MMDHFGVQVDDIARAAAFYDAVLEPLGSRRIMDHGVAIGYGSEHPAFWISQVRGATPGRESHIGFQASDRAAVQAFFDAAVAHGAEVLHEPRVWPEYHEHYYGGFVRDPDGNNVEACSHGPA